MSKKIGLYIHIPFCKKICPFCDFTKIKVNKDYFDSYIASLEKEIKKAGINRISLGVQSFNDEECMILGRNHDSKQSIKALNIIKSEIENFNIDLIFSIPNSNIDLLDFSLKSALSYKPKHISCYSLTIEPNTPFFKNKVQKSSDSEDKNQFTYLINNLKENNYFQYEISSFSKSGYECEHNKMYWDFDHYIGIGAGAHSLFNNQRFKKSSKILDYIKYPLKKELTCLSEKDLISENIIANLRRIKGLLYEDYQAKYNINFFNRHENTIKNLKNNELIITSKKGFKLTKKGLYLLDNVCLSFL